MKHLHFYVSNSLPLYSCCVLDRFHSSTSYSQRDATFLDLFISTDALRVSGGSSAHHQEHIAVHTASGMSTNTGACCYLGGDEVPSPPR